MNTFPGGTTGPPGHLPESYVRIFDPDPQSTSRSLVIIYFHHCYFSIICTCLSLVYNGNIMNPDEMICHVPIIYPMELPAAFWF